jgi:hypothetical protein
VEATILPGSYALPAGSTIPLWARRGFGLRRKTEGPVLGDTIFIDGGLRYKRKMLHPMD